MISVVIPSWNHERAQKAMDSFIKTESRIQSYRVVNDSRRRMGCLEAMAFGAKMSSADDILLFVHDDVEMLSPGWDFSLEELFQNELKCGLVGFGGAKVFGRPDIYKRPYELEQLIRFDFRSNMKDWQAHGTQTLEEQKVAFVDGFALAFRPEAYMAMGGWSRPLQEGFPPFHAYDMWAAIQMRKTGWETWLCPLKCHHSGGATSTTQEYLDFIRAEGWKDGDEVFREGHRMCYEEGRGILPIVERV